MSQVIGSRIRDLRTEREMTQGELGKELGVGNTSISQYESGARLPDIVTIEKLADVFKVSTDSLLGRTAYSASTPSLSQSVSIPILGRIKAGIPVLAEENWEGEIEVPANLKAEFALRVSGDSMSWAGIHDGDTAIMRRTDSPSAGMILAVGMESASWDATLKYFVKENGQAYLRAANPDYPDIPYTKDHRVVGWTVAVLKEPPAYPVYKQMLMRKELADKKWELAIEVAQQHGLDGEQVANLIALFAQTVKHVVK